MSQTQAIPAIFAVSGGAGTTGDQLVPTLLVPFSYDAVQVKTVGNVPQLNCHIFGLRVGTCRGNKER